MCYYCMITLFSDATFIINFIANTIFVADIIKSARIRKANIETSRNIIMLGH